MESILYDVLRYRTVLFYRCVYFSRDHEPCDGKEGGVIGPVHDLAVTSLSS
jgi:hypothetical protein